MIYLVLFVVVIAACIGAVVWFARLVAGAVDSPWPARYLAARAMTPVAVVAVLVLLGTLVNAAGFTASPTLAEAGRVAFGALLFAALVAVFVGLVRYARPPAPVPGAPAWTAEDAARWAAAAPSGDRAAATVPTMRPGGSPFDTADRLGARPPGEAGGPRS